MRRVALLALMALCTACTTGNDEDAGPPDMDSGMDSGAPAVDSGPRSCTTNVECDDGFPCTIDNCIVGNVCDYETVDARCGMDERCVVGRGCVTGLPSDCTQDSDCDDGDACTGTETCARNMCIPGRMFDCDDGNVCTVDICDDSLAGMCRYEVSSECDGGGPGSDAGPPCDTFDPATDYTGTYSLLPGQACDAGFDGYNVSSVSFSEAGGTLTVQAGPFTLTQMPAPTTNMFDVSGGNGCANIRLTGTFACRGSFRGTWMSSHLGSCSSRCTNANANVAGL